jgi:acyl-CoA synthetase (AMP-forming)/AMP-acid ligase II
MTLTFEQTCRHYGMTTLGAILQRNATWWPERDAFVMGAQRLTYAALYERGSRLAAALEELGVRKQDRIGIVSANSIEYFEFYAAAEIAGFIAAPFSFRAAPPEIEHMVTDSGTCVLFFETSLAPTIDGLRSRLPAVQHYVCVGGQAPDWALDYEELLAGGDPAGPRSRAEPDDFVHLFYTSGTTGKPKGVPLTHRGQVISAHATANHPALSLLQISPAFHIGGRGPSLGCYWVGGKTVLHKTFDPAAFMQTVQDERINASFMVPMMVQALLDHPQIDEYDLSSLELVMLASTTIPTDLLRRALERFGQIFYLAYGSTEGGGVCRLPRHEVRLDGGDDMTRRLASVGHFEPECDGMILDDDGNPCPTGVVGEVCINNSYNFNGYWNNDNGTREAMHGRALRTGDLGYMDEQGYVFLVDRKKDMLITGGENVYSREVEEALDLHPAVRESAVIGRPDPKWGETVCAVVLLHPGQTLAQADLIAFARTQLAGYKCPKAVVFVDDMPRQNTGKIDKKMLRQLYASS